MTVPETAPPAAVPAAKPPRSSDRRHEEYQYLDLVREIIDEGELRRDR